MKFNATVLQAMVRGSGSYASARESSRLRAVLGFPAMVRVLHGCGGRQSAVGIYGHAEEDAVCAGEDSGRRRASAEDNNE
jgi:hypothetical protein